MKKLSNLKLNFGRLLIAVCLLSVAFAPSVFSQTNEEGKAALVSELADSRSYFEGKMIESFTNFNLTPQCWARVLDKKGDNNGFDEFPWINVAVVGYLKTMEIADLSKLNQYSKEPEDIAEMNKVINANKDNFQFTLNSDSTCRTKAQYKLLLGYASSVYGFFSDSSSSDGIGRGWRPKSAKVNLIVNVNAKFKDIQVIISPDGKNFTVNAPSENEPDIWDPKIKDGLRKGGSIKVE
jgi:hypothetical protein